MKIPPIIELEEAAKKLVWAAKKKGTLKELTPRLIRQTIEKQLGLVECSLDTSEYKPAIKSALKSAVDEDPPSEEEKVIKPPAKANKRRKFKHEEDDQPTPKSKGKSSVLASKDKEAEGSAKKKRKTVRAKKVESEEENSDSEVASPATTTKKKISKRKETKQFKSLEHVLTSDIEQDEPGIQVVNIAGPSITKADSPKKEKKGSPVEKKTVPSTSSKEAQSLESKPTDSQQSAAPDVRMKDVFERAVSSDLSELDEPKPKQKAKAINNEHKATKTKEKEKKSTKSSTTLTKDEETIKRLKSLILACGVRKVWSKVFQDLDSPSQQIKKLKEVLADLGMTGRMSMDQAKTIKRKRELAQELEDVQQFEKAVLGRSSRSRSQATAKMAAVEEDSSEKATESDSEDEGEDEAPKRRPTNARKSINAFLQDQSDEE